MPRILTIVGATGTQGSSVVDAALKDSESWHVRGITRDPASQAAQAIKERGVEVVKADLTDLSSLTRALEGSYAVFAATDFFGPFGAFNADAEKAMQVEWTQTDNIIKAALGCKTLEHFVYSTLPHAARISNGKFEPGHFRAKNRGEDLIRTHPSLLAKTTFAYVGWYASNFQYPTFKPTWMETSGTLVQIAPVPADVPLYTIGDPRANIGKFVLAILARSEVVLPGRCVHVSLEETSMAALLETWSEVTGKKVRYVQTTLQSYDALWPSWGEVEGLMLQFYDQFRYVPWLPDGEKMVMATDLGLNVGDMVGVAEALRQTEV